MPAQTGLSQLGDALLRGSGDYANIQLRRQQEDRQRVNQLADMENARRYSEGQAEKGVDRQKEMFTWQQKQARIRELIALGFLSEADAADEEAVAFAYALAKARTSAQVHEADEYAKQEKAYVNDIARQAKDEQDKIGKYQDELAAIPSEPVPPTEKEIDKLARRLAKEAGVDYDKDAERARFQLAAIKSLKEDALTSVFLQQKRADTIRILINGSNQRLQAYDSQLSDFARRKILPTIKPPPATAPTAGLAAPASALREAPPEVTARAAGGSPPAPAGVGASTALPNPMNNAALANFQAQQEQQAQIDAKQGRTQQLANLLRVRDDARARGASAGVALQAPIPSNPRLDFMVPEMIPTRGGFAQEISAAGQDELKAQNAYQKLLMQLGPLPQLPKIKAPAPASVFSLPDPYGAPIF